MLQALPSCIPVVSACARVCDSGVAGDGGLLCPSSIDQGMGACGGPPRDLRSEGSQGVQMGEPLLRVWAGGVLSAV